MTPGGREREAREALAGLLALIDEGLLVRNTTNDGHLPSFLAESTRLVKALHAAKSALAPQEREEPGVALADASEQPQHMED